MSDFEDLSDKSVQFAPPLAPKILPNHTELLTLLENMQKQLDDQKTQIDHLFAEIEEDIFLCCLDQIDHFFRQRLNLNFYDNDIKHIYGGLTVQYLEARKHQHINDTQPIDCNNNWKIESLSSYKITKKLTLERYLIMNKIIEQYLIDRLDKIYGIKCVNAREPDGNIIQTGCRGEKEEELTVGLSVKFYIFYEKDC